MLATLITLSRFPLLGVVIVTLYRGSHSVRLVGVALLFVGLLLDTLDGVIARKRNQVSLVGGVLDIAADRTYELVLWMCFADLGLVPIVIPLIVAARTALTDAFRSVGVGRGSAPFVQLRTRLAHFLVGSPWLRTGYGVSKVATFCSLALVAAFGSPSDQAAPQLVTGLLDTLVWITVALCLVRGLPVILEGVGQYAVPAAGPRTA